MSFARSFLQAGSRHRHLPGTQQDFSDGLAQDWDATSAADWSVTNDEYVFDPSNTRTRGTSLYEGVLSEDATIEALLSRDGRDSYMSGLFARSSQDFVRRYRNVSGSAYATGISFGGRFWVGKYVGTSFTWLTNRWESSPFLNGDGSDELVRLEVEGQNIRVYHNDNLAWSGDDSSLTGRFVTYRIRLYRSDQLAWNELFSQCV